MKKIHFCHFHPMRTMDFISHSAISLFLFLNKTDATIGAPIRDITEFIGNAPSKPGRRAIILQPSASAAPVNMVAGKSILWSDVFHIALQR